MKADFRWVILVTVIPLVLGLTGQDIEKAAVDLDGNSYVAFPMVDGTGDLDKKGKYILPMYFTLKHFPTTKVVAGTLVKSVFLTKNDQIDSIGLESYFLNKGKMKGSKRFVFNLQQRGTIQEKKVKAKILDQGERLSIKLKNSLGKKVKVIFRKLSPSDGGLYLGNLTMDSAPADDLDDIFNTIFGVQGTGTDNGFGSATTIHGPNNLASNYGKLMMPPGQNSYFFFDLGKGSSDLFPKLANGAIFSFDSFAHYENGHSGVYEGTVSVMGAKKKKKPSFDVSVVKSGVTRVNISITNTMNVRPGFKVFVTDKNGNTNEFDSFNITQIGDSITISVDNIFFPSEGKITIQNADLSEGERNYKANF